MTLADGMRIVVGGGCDYYPGSATSSPNFTFAVTELRVEGEGDLLIQLERLRRRLAADGLFEPQKRLPRPLLPRTIGVVTGERGKARDDVLAGLRRRGWAGTLVWAFAPVQDRHAAPRIAAALRELAAIEQVEVVIVARGGGSLADLFAFCDEGLCRTVALLRVPVISSVGHHTDRTLIDDVAAVCCSTPTHAAEAAVRIDCRAARSDLAAYARRLQGHGRRALVDRARALSHLSRAPGQHVSKHRKQLHQLLRELRASARRACEQRTLTRGRPSAGPAANRRARPELGHGQASQASSSACAWRSPRTTLSGRWPAATRWLKIAPANRWRRWPRRAPPATLKLRLPRRDRRPRGWIDRSPSRDRAQLRVRRRAGRGDHPPARLRRGRAARDARSRQGGPRARRVLRERARGGERRPRGASARRARRAPRGGRAPRASRTAVPEPA